MHRMQFDNFLDISNMVICDAATKQDNSHKRNYTPLAAIISADYGNSGSGMLPSKYYRKFLKISFQSEAFVYNVSYDCQSRFSVKSGNPAAEFTSHKGWVRMLHIAVCDDMQDQLKMISGLVNDYIEEKKLDAEVHLFQHPDSLLTVCERERFHLYLLDMVMPMMTGVQLGIEIRRLDHEAQIIYATTAPEFALDSFMANPLSYLIKPVERQKLFDTLDLAFSKIDTREEAAVSVKTCDGLRVLPLSSIACCERMGNSVRYLLTTGEAVESLTIRCPFSEHIAPLLRDGRFLQPHVSFALNMSRVESFSEQGFTLRGGAVVPIAQKQYKAVRNAYLDYRFKKGSFET